METVRREKALNLSLLGNFSRPLLSWRVLLTTSLEKQKIENVKVEWKKLWNDRVNDRVRAEGIAATDYSELFVDKGTVICASRDYKALDLKEILERHQVTNAERFIPPPTEVGGWGAFIKKNITSQPKSTAKRNLRAETYKAEMKNDKEKQSGKKSGRGWLHA